MLKRGPAFLLLGQDYLRLESGTDPFLSEVLRKYGQVSTGPSHYGNILEGEAQNSIESALAWMQERCERLSLPEWLRTVASFTWSGVYTSAIDAIWPRAFRSQWRELQPLFEEKYRPIDPRNRSRLHCTFLFGCVNRIEEAERPPLTRFEWLKRKQVAVALARRLPEAVTPFGVLVIEGYAGESDWLSPEDLLPSIDELNPGQTHIFSVTGELAQNPYVADFVERGKLILHNEGLATYLLRGEEAGFLRLGRRPEEEEHGRRIRLEERILTVPSDIWNQVSRSAIVLDDTVLIPLPPLSKDTHYREFRSFLSESSVRPPWSGYERGFAFQRDFEKELRKEVDKGLKSKTLQDEPVIIHGQTGTGKTVALGALAYAVRKKGKHPVLFIERKSQRPFGSDIDVFCQWAEDSEAPTCLVVWDGMVEAEQYFDLLQYLVGRGRKIVLVGSCYRTEELQKGCFIEAPAHLSESEVSRLTTFLKSSDSSLGRLLDEQSTTLDSSYLVALYRLLPPTRGLLRTGVTREVGYVEQEIQRRASELVPEFKPGYALAHAFLRAELITEEHFLSLEIREIGDEGISEPQALVGLVMVSGQFGLTIPLELLLRALGKEAFSNFAALFRKADIFRWHEDLIGNIVIGPRHPLEAQLFVQARLGGAKTEVAFAKRLLLEVHFSDGSFDNPEIQFAVDLIRSMGPNSQNEGYFAPHFRDLAEALYKLRTERGVQNPRLMLQEANLLREWVVKQSQSGSLCVDAEEVLGRAETVLRQALESLESERRNRKLWGSLLIELASVLGTRARHILDHKQQQDSIRFFQEARSQLVQARILDPEDYYPIDVLAWTTRDLLQADILDPQARAEAEVDILHAFEMAEVEGMGIAQQEKFHSRHLEIGDLLGKQEISEEAFRSLLAQGSSAGYYLRASRMAGELPTDTGLSSTQHQHCSDAANYLEEHRQAISHDGRCLYLLLRLWWMAHTGKPMFCSERETVPFNREEWHYCLGVIIDLMGANQLYTNPSLTYLRGLASFHLGRIQEAFEIFRELERESDLVRGRRRIVRHYLASTPDGEPKKFNGTVTWVFGNKGALYVEELRRNVTFLPRDFGKPDIQKGDALSGFYLAFNFLNPVADPPRYLRAKQMGES